MSNPGDSLDEIRKELQWVNVKDSLLSENKHRMNIVYKILVPAGLLITAGVLGRGIYFMFQRDCRKQQLFMRYRVLAQGITVAVASLGILHVKLTT